MTSQNDFNKKDVNHFNKRYVTWTTFGWPDRFNDTYGTHWMAIVGDNHGCAVNHNCNFAHFHLTKKYADKPRKEKDVVVFKIA